MKIRGYGQGRMDVPDVEARSVLPDSSEKVCCRCEKASFEAEAAVHHLSV